MSDRIRHAASRLLIILLTIAAVWGVLSYRTENAAAPVVVGEPSPQQFVAPEEITGIVDVAATTEARQAAADGVADILTTSDVKTETVMAEIETFFDLVKTNAVIPNAVTTVEVVDPFVDADPDEPATSGESTTTSAVPNEVTVAGALYLDLDADGLFSADAGDVPLPDVDVVITDATGVIATVRSDEEGLVASGSLATEGPLLIEVNTADPDFPADFALATSNNPQVIEDVTPDTIDLAPIGFAPHVRSIELQEGLLEDEYRFLFAYEATIPTLVSLATEDVTRAALGLDSQLAQVRLATLREARERLTDGIADEELGRIKVRVFDTPPFIVLDEEFNSAASDAAADVIALHLIPTLEVDEAATQEARDAAAAGVEEVLIDFKAGETIVDKGEVVTAVQNEAITMSDLNRPTATQYAAMMAIIAVLVLVVMFYIARFRPVFWNSTRRVALFGILLVLAAGSVRLVPAVGVVSGFEGLSGYAIPAAGFGFIVAILFDARLAVLTALAVAAITGISTGDTGYAVYALLSAIGPVPFVSAISTRADFRRALGYSSALAALIAASGAWFFHAPLLELPVVETVSRAAVLAFVVSLLSTLVAGMALSFFEVAFDITTTLRLLDVTDRNHPALQTLQEHAWGTFNHSLMVGTLAEQAARAIGANNLLALAAAYYHDLGKTENPTYFIENQFGVGNPHDLIPPDESAKIIRQHVVDGIELAKKYRIPSEVAEGIVCHHGDGIMQYFYQQAIELHGPDAVNVDDYRHIGHKPKTREMAILMMADALEGASRAVFSEEDPSPQKITALVERIVGEKLGDGQLSESDLTLGELTIVKTAFAEALLGHYHQRIPYPNFPQGDALSEGRPAALPPTADAELDGEVLDLPSVEAEPGQAAETESDVIPMRRQKER